MGNPHVHRVHREAIINRRSRSEVVRAHTILQVSRCRYGPNAIGTTKPHCGHELGRGQCTHTGATIAAAGESQHLVSECGVQISAERSNGSGARSKTGFKSTGF